MSRIYAWLTIALLSVWYVPVTAVIQQPGKTIAIKAISGMQYDIVRFQVKPGEQVTLTLENADDMAHNLIIVAPGTREKVANAALELGEKGPAMNYVPESPDVLWSIPLIYPGEKKSVTFTAPTKPGAYPYVCTYPGHGFIMYGVMYVSNDKEMPDIHTDANIPKGAAGQHHEHQALHPYKTVAPYWYRVFLEESSLSTIAVHLPGSVSYAWDMETCRLRVIWTGGFLDNTDLWHGHKNAYAHIQGTVFFRDSSPSVPIRTGDGSKEPAADYKGYRIVNRYPEFHYVVDGKDVFELIQEKPDGNGLIRTIRIPEADGPMWFFPGPEQGVTYEFSSGDKQADKIRLSAEQARKFTIHMTKK